MTEPMTMMAMGGFALTALAIALLAGLKGWQGWLELKRLELSGHGQRDGRSPVAERIEVADLKERIRKLEAIASYVDL